MSPNQKIRAFFSIAPDCQQLALTGLAAAVLLAIFSNTAWAFPTYDGCADCHGGFEASPYISLQDGTNWGIDLMQGHWPFVERTCNACHKTGGRSEVFLNQSSDDNLFKGCVGCHGRDEDVSGNCTGLSDSQGGVDEECGSGAGLREYHESRIGAGTCSECHQGDSIPVGEHIAPFNYGLNSIVMKDSCDGDGTEGRFGANGLDNDGDGKRDADDSNCQAFTINAGLNDAWFNFATNGQGFLITVFPDIKQMFLAWFTYDTERPSEDVTAFLGEPGHRWLTAQGPYAGDTANLTIFVTEGGVFDAAEPAASTDPAGDGTMTIQFINCSEGLVNYEIASLGISGDIPIQRISPDNVPLCEALSNP